MMVNGLMGENPLIYNYDLYAFGLILRQVLDSYVDVVKQNKLFDPRKYRAKKTKRRQTKHRQMKGGFKLYYRKYDKCRSNI